MKTVLWSIFLIVGCMLLTVQCVAGSNSISSFSVKSGNTKSSSWDEDCNIRPGQDVRLECTIGEDSQLNELHIKRADGYPLSIYNARDIQRDSQSLVVILRSIECSQMGTYVCESGQGEKKTVDFGIYDCPPQPCKDQSTDITLYASVNKLTEFSVCVEAFPNVNSFALNGKEVRFDWTNAILPGAYCTKSKSGNVFSTYQISCTIKVGDEVNYGVHDFSIFSEAAQNQRVTCRVKIEKPGPPECPTGIKSTNQGRDSVTLLWQPVNNRGGSQPVTCTIFYTSNGTEWQRYMTVEGTQATINELKADTFYEFRVASANEHRPVTNESTCSNAIRVKTAKDARASTDKMPPLLLTGNDDNNTNASDELIIAIPSVVGVLIVAGVMIALFCYRRKRKTLNSQPLTRTPPFNRDGNHIQENPQVSLI